MQYKILITLISIFISGKTFSQPYIYDSQSLDDNNKKWNNYRLNLQTGAVEFLERATRFAYSDDNTDQSILIKESRLGELDIHNIKTGKHIALPFENYARRVNWLVDAIPFNKLYLHITDCSGTYEQPMQPDKDKTYIIDKTTDMFIDSTDAFITTFKYGDYDKPFFSKDYSKMYFLKTDTGRTAFTIVSTANNKEIGTQYCGTSSDKGYEKYFVTGKNGVAVLKYLSEPRNESKQKLVVCDVDNGTIQSIISFPWSFSLALSFDTKLLFVEKIRTRHYYPENSSLLATERIKTGEYYVFDTKTGGLINTMSLPKGGSLLLFENYPNTIYYTFHDDVPSASKITPIATNTTIMSVVELFNWFSSTVLAQSIANKEVVNSAFINQLQTHIDNAKNYYLQNDIANAKKELTKFRERLGNTPQRKEGNPFVKKEGYKNLFFNAGYLMGRL